MLAVLAAQAAAHTVEADSKHSIPKDLASERDLENWQLSGAIRVDGGENKLAVTDQGQSSARGSIWNKVPVALDKWTVDLEFNVKGPQSPSAGGLAFWYTQQQGGVGTVHGSNDKWDGLGLFIDSVAEGVDSSTGTLRGHLNDGSIVYNAERPSDQAFTQCQLHYRNTDYNVQVKVSYQDGFFRIMANGQHCFQTDQLLLPRGGYFGVSADSGQGDGVSLTKLQVLPEIDPRVDVPIPQLQKQLEQQANEMKLKQQEEKQRSRQQQQQQQQQQGGVSNTVYDDILKKLAALEIASGSGSSGQAHAPIDFQEVKADIKNFERKQAEVHAAIDQKMASLETVVKELILLKQDQSSQGSSSGHCDVAGQIGQLHARLESLDRAVKDHHLSLAGSIPDTVSAAVASGGTSIWLPFTLFVVIQGGVFAGYIVYKNRRANYHAKII